MGMYLDFTKIFDTAGHVILLQKLYRYGVRGCVHDWVAGYLSLLIQVMHVFFSTKT